MNAGLSMKVESQRRRAVCTEPPVLRFVATTPRIVKNKELTLCEIPELTVATRIRTCGYHKAPAVTEISTLQRRSRLLNSAEETCKPFANEELSIFQRLAATSFPVQLS